jgi:hypothetical protein
MRLGEVRELKTEHGENTIRVIGFDDLEVFYDVWWEHSNKWGLEGSRSASFYRLPSKFCEVNSSVIRIEELSEKEVGILQPDLPLRTSILSKWKWDQNEYVSLSDFELKLGSSLNELESQPLLNTDKVILIPSGPNGGDKKGVIIEADDGISFGPVEILWKAHNVQSKYETNAKDGVGIYRLGISKKIPSYYLGERYDRAGNNTP